MSNQTKTSEKPTTEHDNLVEIHRQYIMPLSQALVVLTKAVSEQMTDEQRKTLSESFAKEADRYQDTIGHSVLNVLSVISNKGE